MSCLTPCPPFLPSPSPTLTPTQVELNDLRPYVDVGFVRVNCQPLKQGLGTWLTKWSHTYTSFLSDFVLRRLTWLHGLLESTDSALADVGLGAGGEEAVGRGGRPRGLLTVVRLIQRLRRLHEPVSLMFEPLGATIAMLKSCGHSVQVGTTLHQPCALSWPCVCVCWGGGLCVAVYANARLHTVFENVRDHHLRGRGQCG
jgi:hypothetical protein